MSVITEVGKAVLPVDAMKFWQLRDLCNSEGIDPRGADGSPSKPVMLEKLRQAGITSGEVRTERPARAVAPAAVSPVVTPAVPSGVVNHSNSAISGGDSGAGVVGSAVVDSVDNDDYDIFDDDVPESSPVVAAAPVASAGIELTGSVNGGMNGHANGHHAVNGAPNAADVLGGMGGDKVAALQALIGLLSQPATPGVSEDRVCALINDSETRTQAAFTEGIRAALTNISAPRTIEITRHDSTKIEVGVQHKHFPLLLKLLEARVPVMLVGEAGSGKTTAAHIAADALGIGFHPLSFCALTSKADLLGYTDIHREYQSTPFRRAYESGGVFCADEFDAGNPNATMVLNAGLANGTCGFPDGTISRSPDFCVVACANTFGRGADSRFIGRNKMDAATLDRFAVLRWDIDSALESHLAGVPTAQEEIDIAAGGVISNPQEWLEYVQRVRSVFQSQQLEYVISSRAVINGLALFRVGVGRAHVEDLLIFKGMDAETRAKVERALSE